jgi:hypothetical protein
MTQDPKAWIDRAGGYRAVAQRLGEGKTTVHNWTVAATFPLAEYHRLRDLARELGVDPPPDELFPFRVLPPMGAAQ